MWRNVPSACSLSTHHVCKLGEEWRHTWENNYLHLRRTHIHPTHTDKRWSQTCLLQVIRQTYCDSLLYFKYIFPSKFHENTTGMCQFFVTLVHFQHYHHYYMIFLQQNYGIRSYNGLQNKLNNKSYSYNKIYLLLFKCKPLYFL